VLGQEGRLSRDSNLFPTTQAAHHRAGKGWPSTTGKLQSGSTPNPSAALRAYPITTRSNNWADRCAPSGLLQVAGVWTVDAIGGLLTTPTSTGLPHGAQRSQGLEAWTASRSTSLYKKITDDIGPVPDQPSASRRRSATSTLGCGVDHLAAESASRSTPTADFLIDIGFPLQLGFQPARSPSTRSSTGVPGDGARADSISVSLGSADRPRKWAG